MLHTQPTSLERIPLRFINEKPIRLDLSHPKTPRPPRSTLPHLPTTPHLSIPQPPNPLILHPLLPLLPPPPPLHRPHLHIPQHQSRRLHARILQRVNGAENRFRHAIPQSCEPVAAHQHDGVVGLRIRGGCVVAVFGEEGGCEGGAGGAYARDVAVRVGEVGGEGGAEGGGVDEEVVG